MNDILHFLIPALQTQYRFKEIQVISKNPMIVGTERGLKKIRFWTDERLLRKHLNWRRNLMNDRFFLDRMYVNQSGHPFIRMGRYSVTCHDAPPDRAEFSGNEALWASVCSVLLKRSRDLQSGYDRPIDLRTRAKFSFEQASRTGILSGEAGKLISTCYSPACARAGQADLLRSRHQRRSRSFIVPMDFSFRNCKALLGTLFVELGQCKPVTGYQALARFFLEQMVAEGEASLQRLFISLKKEGPPDRETSDLLRAEWFEPKEWFHLLTLLSNQPESNRRKEEIQAFKAVWDQKTRLINLFDSFFSQPDDGRKAGEDGGNFEKH
ncbi:hypothetical protein EWI07_06800 [Sporolactobacillus sp. THM7-4]|nr:hypothetical protein EWI07_06800 [Sporolactobacillus sp. THM7-4]